MSAQTPHGFMAVKEGHWTDGAKILYHGRTYRPAGAKDLCGTCWEARDHFERARRLRIRSFLIAKSLILLKSAHDQSPTIHLVWKTSSRLTRLKN